MNTLDLVAVFLLAGVVENATIGDDTSVLAGSVSALRLVAASRAVRRLVDTSPLAQRILEGRPTTVIEHGELRPSGRIVLTLKPDERSSTKADIAALERRLKHIETMLSAQR